MTVNLAEEISKNMEEIDQLTEEINYHNLEESHLKH